VAKQSADKRVERSKAKVLAETYRQLAQSGIGGVSIDEISRVSGISKTTIYRHWPTRSALLIDACCRLGSVPEAPDTGSFEGDARLLLANLASQLQTENWSSVYPSIIDAAERDAEISAMQAALHEAFMAPFSVIVERAQAKGELAPERSTTDLVAALVGPFFFRRWFSKEEIDSRFIDAIIQVLSTKRSPPARGLRAK
jgi:AcrR family transcriptional regulator